MKKYFIILFSIVLLYSCNKDKSSINEENIKRPISVSTYENNKLLDKDWYTYADGLVTQIDRTQGIGMSYERTYRYTFEYSSSGIEVKYFQIEDEELEFVRKVTYHFNGALLIRKDFYFLENNDFVDRSIEYSYQNNFLIELKEIFFNIDGTSHSNRIDFKYDGNKLVKQSRYNIWGNSEQASEYFVYEYSNNEIKESRYFDLKAEELSYEVYTFQNSYIIHSDLYYRNGTENIHLIGEIDFEYDVDGYLINRNDDYPSTDYRYFIQYESKSSNLNLFRDPQGEFKYAQIPVLPFSYIWWKMGSF